MLENRQHIEQQVVPCFGNRQPQFRKNIGAVKQHVEHLGLRERIVSPFIGVSLHGARLKPADHLVEPLELAQIQQGIAHGVVDRIAFRASERHIRSLAGKHSLDDAAGHQLNRHPDPMLGGKIIVDQAF